MSLRVKRKQSQSFCNVSCQPSLIAFYPAVENKSRDMSKSIYSILSCLPNITTNTNKFIVLWIPLCNWIERVVDLFYLKRKRKFYEWVKFCQRSSPSPNYLLKESSLGFLFCFIRVAVSFHSTDLRELREHSVAWHLLPSLYRALDMKNELSPPLSLLHNLLHLLLLSPARVSY